MTAAGTAAAVTDSDADSDLAAPSHHDVVTSQHRLAGGPAAAGVRQRPGRGARAAAATIIMISRIMIVRDHDVDLDH